jgi:hypothetical protein
MNKLCCKAWLYTAVACGLLPIGALPVLAQVAAGPGNKIDLSAQLSSPEDRWELAVIGDDINNKITAADCSNGNFGGEIFGGEITGGTGVGPAGIDGVSCFVDPGRETGFA